MRAKRQALSAEEQDHASAKLSQQLLRLSGLLSARRIGAYVANDGEMDPLPAIESLVLKKIEAYLPVLFGSRRPRVRFARYYPAEPMTPGRFGIPTPFHDKRDLRDPMELDWLLMPLVAFDDRGNRLGMGGGFYDASLASRANRRFWRRPRLIGIAHEFQRVDNLTLDSWDIPLDGILTDQKFREFV